MLYQFYHPPIFSALHLRKHLIGALAVLISFALPAQEEVRNAAFYQGTSADDQMIATGCLLESSELVLFSSESDASSAITNSRAFDFLPTDNGSPFTNLVTGSVIDFNSIDPVELNPVPADDFRESLPLLVDFDQDGRSELMRLIEDDDCELLLFYHPLGYDLTDLSVSDVSSGEFIDRIERPEPSCNSLAEVPDQPTIKMVNPRLGSTSENQIVIAYLTASADFFQLNLRFIGLGDDVAISSDNTITIDIPFASSNSTHSELPYFDLDFEDLTLDGNDEVVLAYGKGDSTVVSVFNYTDGNYQQALTTSIPFHTVNGNLDLTIGDFNGDLAPEIALGLAWHKFLGQNRVVIFVFQPVDVVEEEQPDTNLLQQLIQLGSHAASIDPTASNATSARAIINIEAGDVTASGNDEIVVGYAESLVNVNGRFSRLIEIEVLEYDGEPNNLFFQNTNNPGVRNFSEGPTPIQMLQVADLNRDRKAEIVVGVSERPSGTSSNTPNYIQKIFIYNDNGTIVLEELGQFESGLQSVNDFEYFHFHLLTNDLDADEIRLGTPSYFEVADYQHPLVVLNAPPIHFDLINDQLVDINGCVDFDECEFAATYSREQTTEVVASTTAKSDWATTASLEVEGGSGVSVKATLETTYGESFESYQSSSQTFTVASEITANTQDRIFASIATYGIYEYPVLEGDSVIGSIATVTPQISQRTWFNTDSWTAFDYFPRHEVGNILSYPSYASLNDDPTLQTLIKSGELGDDAYTVDATSQQDFSVTFTDVEAASTTQSSNFGIGGSVTVTAGKKLFGVGAELSVGVSGEYNREDISTYETTVTESINLGVSLRNHEAGLESDYKVTPYHYWASNGALVLDYSVDPDVAPPGGTPTWWQTNYGQAPDPGLLLPFRLWPERGIMIEDEFKRQESRGIAYSPADAERGDTITIFAAIHNFSLIPTDLPVPVNFWLCTGDGDFFQLTNTDGQTTVRTDGPLASRERQLVAFEWVIPEDLEAGFPRIYAAVNPNDEIELEITDTNNLGWNILNISGPIFNSEDYTGCALISSTEETGLASEVPEITVFPNPTTDHINFKIANQNTQMPLRIDIYSTSGQLIYQQSSGILVGGTQTIVVPGNTLPPGMYYYRIVSGHTQATGAFTKY
ncbi:MAG: T9SS type A sorting domain-containing protein [Bacteroidota bacterium]